MLDGSHYGVVATQQQQTTLRLWIDAGAPYPGTYAALGSGAVGGYQQNKLVNTDFDWPTTVAGAEVIKRRCAPPVTRKTKGFPTLFRTNLRLSFWRFDLDDPRFQYSRHIVFNLTRPEKSLMLLAPLKSRPVGMAHAAMAQKPVPVFRDTNDPDYQALLAMIQAGKSNLDQIKRFDMPGFQPPEAYLREMKRYGILPPDTAPDAVPDGYTLDRLYWQSLWYRPANGN